MMLLIVQQELEFHQLVMLVSIQQTHLINLLFLHNQQAAILQDLKHLMETLILIFIPMQVLMVRHM